MKQEAKVVYLLECLQKTSPPVSKLLFFSVCRDNTPLVSVLLKNRGKYGEQVQVNSFSY